MQYRARILGLMEGKEPVAVQKDTYPQITELLSGVAPQKLRQRPAPDKWSIAEVLAHLAEAEVVST